jgi:hypothetical protein
MNKKILYFVLFSTVNSIFSSHHPKTLNDLDADCLLITIELEPDNMKRKKTILTLREVSRNVKKKVDHAYLETFSLQTFFNNQDNVIYNSLFAKWIVENTYFAQKDYFYNTDESAPISEAFGVPNNYEKYQKEKFGKLLSITDNYPFFISFIRVFLNKIPSDDNSKKIFEKSIEIFFYKIFFKQKIFGKQKFYRIINFFADNWSNDPKFTALFQQYFSLLFLSEYLKNLTKIEEKGSLLAQTSATILEKCLQYNQNKLLHTFMIFFLPCNRSFSYLISIAERLLKNGNDKNEYYEQTLKTIIDILCENTFDDSRYFEQESRIGQLCTIVENCIIFGCDQNNFHNALVDRIFNLFLDQDPQYLIEFGKLCLLKKAYFKYFFHITTYLILSEVVDPYWDSEHEKVTYLLLENKECMTTAEQILIQEYFDMLSLCFDDSKARKHKENIRCIRELLQYTINQKENSENKTYREYAKKILSFLNEN